MSYQLNAITLAACSLILLLVVLRCRRFTVPRRMKAGAIILCISQIFPLASAIVGFERISRLLEGKFFPDDESTSYFISETPVSADYFQVSELFGALGQVGVLLLALGFLKIVRQQIADHQAQLVQPS
ncbi:hypothetical protein [Haloferula rosea]|uniref:Uncharacterized protein n=1 Tax=Haloferula rosea TaxID=490093 RepID=A0A934RCN4_9BACT|nr:hypothetical protein [Haloferula rosea]MBK1828248.1 hypothetical protein [Haloferula rosea]